MMDIWEEYGPFLLDRDPDVCAEVLDIIEGVVGKYDPRLIVEKVRFLSEHTIEPVTPNWFEGPAPTVAALELGDTIADWFAAGRPHQEKVLDLICDMYRSASDRLESHVSRRLTQSEHEQLTEMCANARAPVTLLKGLEPCQKYRDDI